MAHAPFSGSSSRSFGPWSTAEPDLYLSLGDAIYGDFDGETTFDVTPESLREEWQELADNPDWQHLTANVPVMAVWDNHDYGKAEGGAEFALKAQAQEIFSTSSASRRIPSVGS